MAAENRLSGQKRIQAELAKLGFEVSARTVAKYMRVRRSRGSTGMWREFLTRHASDIWACDFFCVPTVLFQTLHVFFVIRLANREILHVEVTRHPTAGWVAQQIVECCAWDRAPPRFLIHDRDSRYGASFDRRVRGLGMRQVRTPFRSPRANAVAERRVRSARSECLDHLIVFSEANLRRILSAYVTYYNRWRPHLVFNEVLAPPVVKTGRESLHHADRTIRRAQQQRTGVRSHWTSVERGHHFASFDGFKFEEIRGTVCRHRGAPRIIDKSLRHNHFR
jgi:putative transposase